MIKVFTKNNKSNYSNIPLFILVSITICFAPALVEYDFAQEYEMDRIITSEVWYDKNVLTCQEYGLEFWSEDEFLPDTKINISEGVAIISNLHRYINGNPIDSYKDNPDWLQDGWHYAIDNGIIAFDTANTSPPLNRDQFANLFFKVLPNNLRKINNISSIPGYLSHTDIGNRILSLYEAGILIGNCAQGYFSPFKPITLAEVAAMISRAIEPRIRVQLTNQFSPDNQLKTKRLPFGTDLIHQSDILKFTGDIILVRHEREMDSPYMSTAYDQFGNMLFDYLPNAYLDELNGIVRAIDENGDIIYFKSNGRRLNDTPFNWGYYFNEKGFALVQQNSKDHEYLVIDDNGVFINTVNMDGFQDAHYSDNHKYIISNDHIIVLESNTPIYSDKMLLSIVTGNIISLRPRYSSIEWPFINGLAVVDTNEISSYPGSYNVIDSNFNLILPRTFDYIYIYADVDDAFVVEDYKASRYGIVNRNAEMLAQIEYVGIGPLSPDGHAFFTKYYPESNSYEYSIRNYQSNEIISIPSFFNNGRYFDSRGQYMDFLRIDMDYVDLNKQVLNHPRKIVLSDLYGNIFTPILNYNEIWESSKHNGKAIFYYNGEYYMIEYNSVSIIDQ